MSMNEGAISTGVTAPPAGGANLAVDSPSTTQGAGAPEGQSAGGVTAPVQGADQSTTQTDPLAGVPSTEELKALVEQNVPHAKALAQLRGVYEPLKTQFSELQTKYQPYEPILGRFEQPEQLQSALELHDNLIGWERDSASGELVPSTMGGAERLAREYPQHADFLAADLLNMETRDPQTGQTMSRMDLALHSIAKDPERRAATLRILGAVEPSSISPQWQATTEELEVVRPELQDVYKKLPYEERQELKLAAPDFINRVLEREKLTQDLQAEREQSHQQVQQQQAQREQYVTQQAQAAGEQHVQSQLSNALTTFHNSVVEQCNFLQPIDPQTPPQGMTPEQVNSMNAQIAESNMAEAAQITLAVVGLVNPQTRPFVLPLLQQIGVIDEKLLKEMEQASDGFGNNARNFGELNYRGRLKANGNGFQPDASMTALNNASTQNLNRLVHFANQVKKSLMEKRSQFFSMKATNHNQTLNSAATTRPMAQGSAYDPSTAVAPKPSGWQSRTDIERQFG